MSHYKLRLPSIGKYTRRRRLGLIARGKVIAAATSSGGVTDAQTLQRSKPMSDGRTAQRVQSPRRLRFAAESPGSIRESFKIIASHQSERVSIRAGWPSWLKLDQPIARSTRVCPCPSGDIYEM